MTGREFINRVFFIEIIKGLALTLSRLFSHAVTRQYPKEKRQPFQGFRGLHALAKNEHGKMKCVGCGLCAAVCPSECIYIYTSEGDDHNKVVDRYEIEVLRCVYCALCVEACPYGAVVLTEHFEYSDYSRDALYFNKDRLLENWDKYMAGPKGTEYFEKFWRPKSGDFLTRAKEHGAQGHKPLNLEKKQSEEAKKPEALALRSILF